MFVRLLLLSATSILIAFASPADAHDPALSGISIIYRHDDAVVSVMTHLSRLLASEGKAGRAASRDDLDQAVRRRLHVRFGGKDLIPENVHIIDDPSNDLLNWQTITKSASPQYEILSRIYPEDPNSITVINIVRDGQSVNEVLLDSNHPAFSSTQSSSGAVEAQHYFRQGVFHILEGPDHILFVLGLLLLGGSFKSLIRTITAFTVAHSITLSMSATGIFAPPSKIIEPLIALSIVAIAIENLRYVRASQSQTTTKRHFRPYYAFAFGLIHGFGFAGALLEIGLPASSLWIALASFNVGVECGQALIVVSVAPLLSWLGKKRPAAARKLVYAGSICIGLVGSFWFVTRIFG